MQQLKILVLAGLVTLLTAMMTPSAHAQGGQWVAVRGREIHVRERYEHERRVDYGRDRGCGGCGRQRHGYGGSGEEYAYALAVRLVDRMFSAPRGYYSRGGEGYQRQFRAMQRTGNELCHVQISERRPPQSAARHVQNQIRLCERANGGRRITEDEIFREVLP